MTTREPAIRTKARRTTARAGIAVALLLGAALLAAAPARATTLLPIKLAVFAFELEDFSAGASAVGDTPSDTQQLARVTDEVRQLFAHSERYRLVDVSAADAPALKQQALDDCNGCEAAIAAKLGADQSLMGVVRRISRMEYVVHFVVRDTRSGAVLSDGTSGLRMGANYSWDRGAIELIEQRMPEVQPQH